MFHRRRSQSVPAVNTVAKCMQSRKEPTFQFSVPCGQSRVIDGESVHAPYDRLTYTKNDKGTICLRCLKWSLTARRSSRIPLDSELFAMHAADYQFVNGPMQGRQYDLRELSINLKQPRLHGGGFTASAAKFWYLDPTAAPRAGFSQMAGEGSCIGMKDISDPGALNHLTPVLIDCDALDYPTIQSWLSACSNHHHGDCDSISNESLPSLHLIDCMSMPPRLVNAQPHHKYAALSYVWGRGGVAAPFSGDTLTWRLLPQTIRDAMTVVRRLGMRYLWVDRYCIPAATMKEQISKMDVIYAGAELVIVAAAGDDIEYGLPGEGPRKRTQQPYALVGKDLFVSTLSDLNSRLDVITWWQRAWCFQEALLSRRRLIFTDEKIYFLCRRMLCIETLSLPFQNPNQRPHTSLTEGSSTDFYNWLTTSGFASKDPDQIHDILSAYADKQMSFESDGLNAIVGVLRAFSQRNPGEFYSYGGLPIIGDPSSKAFLSALLWSEQIPERRRAGDFPSWSWVGWTGGFRYHSISRDVDDIEVRVVERDGSTTKWEDFVVSGRLRESPFPLSQYIHLYAVTAMIQVSHLATSRIQHGGAYVVPVQRFPGGRVRYAQVSLGYSTSSGGKLNPDLHAELVGKPSKCVSLISPDDERKLYGIALLLRAVGTHFERIGSFQLDYLGDVYDADDNYDSFLMSTDEKAAIEGFDFQREWISLG
ncbi:hypothetical protein LTS15_009433 [Exophiala xenobiotica]|nr:hypothetical protein LTS15_009433 [Exophiala xenobiotica]